MTSVGSILRRKREADGLSIERIGEGLCIMPSYLRALEADDVRSFPGTFFYKSFALQYAAALGLDPESLRAEIDALCGPKEAEPAHIEPTIQIASRAGSALRRLGWSLTLGLAVCAAVGLSTLRTEVPTTLAVEATVVAPAPEPEVLVEPAAVLSIAAREATWLSISSEGREIFEGVLWPRQSKTLTGLDMAWVKVGNAGGLDISWKGKSIGPIGEAGEVRVVVFSADDVEVLPPGRSL